MVINTLTIDHLSIISCTLKQSYKACCQVDLCGGHFLFPLTWLLRQSRRSLILVTASYLGQRNRCEVCPSKSGV